MRLKKLELLGFKSFADKTEVLFDHGVTCIVGPNGCGKSNVSDAIRWVLGERSAKLLRGSTMEDVIFNGTEVRKPLAFAEVSLTIDNADRGMPIEYNEVTLTRRLYRTGESEYLLNKTLCRLKDIQDLILDTGIGSSSYSMIEQGRIDYILKADPEERRFLVEEAAGIAKYKVKKDESIRKLERTEDNLKRLRDIVLEVQKNIQYAERQAKRAERYKVELERLKTLEIKRAFYDQRTLEHQKQELALGFQGKKEALASLVQKIQEQHLGVEDQESRVRGIGQRCHVKEGERYQALAQIESNEQKLQFIRDKRVELAQQRGQLLQEQEQLKQSIEAGIAKKAEITEQCKAREAEEMAAQAAFDEASQKLNQCVTSVQDSKNGLEAVRREFFDAAQATTHSRNEFNRLRALSENLESQKRREQANALRFKEQLDAWTGKLQACFQALESAGQGLSGFAKDQEGIEQRIRSLEEELAVLNAQGQEARLVLREKESRMQTLAEMDRGHNASFQDFVSEVSQQFPGLVRGLKEVVTVRDGQEWAVDIALGQFARSLIAGDVATARDVVKRLSDRRSLTSGVLLRGQGSIAPLPDETAQLYDALGFRPLAGFVTVEPGYEDAVLPFLGNVFLTDVFPVNELERLIGLAGSGTVLSRDGVVLTGSKQLYFWDDQNQTQFLFSRDAEIVRIRQEIETLVVLAQEKESRSGQLIRELAALRAEADGFSARKTGFLIEKEALEAEKKSVEERAQALQKEVELATAEVNALNGEIEQARGSLAQSESELIRREQDEKKFGELQSQKEQDVAQKLTEQAALQDQVRQSQSKADQFRHSLHHLQESLRLVEHHTQQDIDRQAFLAQGQERITNKEKELDGEESACVLLAAEHQHRLHAVDVELELLRKDQQEQESLLAAQRQSLDDMARDQKALEDEEHQISLRQMDLDYQLRNVGERLVQRYRLNLTELNPQDYLFTDEELQTAEETVAALQAKVDSLGTVNLLAIEEYQELKQRYDFLLAQQKDLEDARDSLMESIRKINQTTKQLFEDTFAQVQETFKQYYQILFCGGEAKIFLIDEAHPLESGIDIVVRPPGKKTQNMSLLSGGEKALTAVALLFALFKIKPSPFCLLDEIDAPLDEANIDRFLTVLRTFLDDSQFIIITHNRKTIAMGDSLYGVTMEEPGVSKIVSVKVRTGEESLPGGNATVTAFGQTSDPVVA
ncbi:MAG: chromosome segregation protein SMC [Candidatus Omnitrophica bacterium]|nr:chromosome segregation protein SMC [Candidatus Omnitrophota bacterium]